MHSVLAFTSMDLTFAQRERLISALTEAGESVFPGDFSLALHYTPEQYSSEAARELLHFIAHVPDSVTLDERRQISRLFQDATVQTLGSDRNQRATILFWKASECDIFFDSGEAVH